MLSRLPGRVPGRLQHLGPAAGHLAATLALLSAAASLGCRSSDGPTKSAGSEPKPQVASSTGSGPGAVPATGASGPGAVPATGASGPGAVPATGAGGPGDGGVTDGGTALGDGTLEQAEALERANRALAAGDVAGARRAWEAAIAGPPSGVRTSAMLALAFALQDTDAAAAQRWYARLVAEAAEVPEVHFAAGRFWATQDDLPGAMRAFRTALRLQPDLLPVYPLLGALLVQTGAPAEAAELFLGYERRLEDLSQRARDPQRPLGERLPIVELFALVDDERAQHTLLTLLGDAQPEVRVAAASSLAELGDPEGLTAIAEAALAERNGVARALLTDVLARARRRLAAAPTEAP